ncbi:DUF5709 domain-containing protein [Actinocatenispora comari]|jgi:hypothetical protein|uniref:DUF5709 domain-containing protein n=1 Tax=Actinocatenispora comari TaxID=2807577 RepID=A0A8J4ABD9_9ACTN|nr:DUF5709 domain-containing protein [Actinocatenispora comari]GIL27793.1 hypothetical protein NUM_30470 [Actinocatenispora comari]
MTSATEPDAEPDGDVSLLRPQESLDDEETEYDPDTGYSPNERPWEIDRWGLTAAEAARGEDLAHRLARELPDRVDEVDGDGIGDSTDTDGEPLDDQVGGARSGRLIAADLDPADAGSDQWALDVGVDGGAASAEEAAIHVVSEREQDDDF